jgi:hypothetical protein
MRIVQRTPDSLVVRDTAAPLRAVGVICAVIGLVFVGLAFGWSGAAGAYTFGLVSYTFGLVIGAGCLVAGALLTLPRTATFAFDKSQRILTVTRRGLLRAPKRETYRLRDIAAVELETPQDRSDPRYRRLAARLADGTPDVTYRVATVMIDRSRHPWTGYYSSEPTGMVAAVEAARQFLDLPPHGELAAPAATLPPTKPSANHRAYHRYLATLAAFCLPFLPYGGWRVWVQHRQLATYRPVPVTVLASRVEEMSGDSGPTYRPVVTYRYAVAGRTYIGKRVTPLNESRSGRWAYDVIGRYAVGTTETAYYDPARPSESFLLRRSSPAPYVFVALPLLALCGSVYARGKERGEGHAARKPGPGVAD